jgi:ribonuclease D
MISPIIVSDSDALANVVLSALETDAVAIDTEFFWERTFYPQLGLVQLALGDGRIFLLDAVALQSLASLGLLLVAPRVQKVLHDGIQDLTLLRRVCGCGAPRNIFDTRLSAGFCGHSSVISLRGLLEQRLGVTIEKDEQRADWLARPLSDNQLRYAALDVAHLLSLKDSLAKSAKELGNDQWLAQELASLDDESLTAERAAEEYFLRFKGRGKLDARGLAILQELSDWREHEARRADVPRNRVFSDDVLLQLVRARPTSLQDVQAVLRAQRIGGPQNRYRRKASAQHALFAAIERANARPEQQCPQPPLRPEGAENGTKRGEKLIAYVEEAAAHKQIDAALVASRSELRKLGKLGASASHNPGDHRVLGGWRKELLGNAFVELLNAP